MHGRLRLVGDSRALGYSDGLGEHTGASMQSRRAFSSCWHPPAAPPEAQQSAKQKSISKRDSLSIHRELQLRQDRCACMPSYLPQGLIKWYHVLSIAVIGPRHGFGCCLSGCLILRCETDCSRMGLTAVEAPLGGILGSDRPYGR